MKTFFQFFTESQAVQQATRMGLQSDGHGGWYSKDGEFVAKTERGQLKFFNKRQRIGKQDPPQSDKEKKLSKTTIEKDKPVEMIPPEVEKTKGTLTVAFGRFNPPTTGHEKLLDTVATSSDDTATVSKSFSCPVVGGLNLPNAIVNVPLVFSTSGGIISIGFSC